MKLVRKKEFVVIALDPEDEIFIVYIAAFASFSSDIHLFCQRRIISLKINETLTAISNEYVDFANIFLSNLATTLAEHIAINNHTINLIGGKQAAYGSIYNLKQVELETLKTYIETNLANGFILSFNTSAIAAILFDRKFDGSLQLYINYQVQIT